jgi:virulence factor Mce-like protein
MPARRVLVAVLLVVLGATAVGVAAWIRIGGGVPLAAVPYEATVRLRDASGLVRGAEVQVSGVAVGEVAAIRPTAGGGDVVLRIEAEHAPLPADTRVTLRTRTALGERFVGLSPGTAGGRAIPDRGRIPSSQVESVPTIGEVLEGLDDRTRAATRRLAGTLRTALRGRGGELGETLGALPGTADGLAALAAVVDGRRTGVASLVRNGDAVLAAVVGSRDDLRGVLRDAGALSAETAGRTRALRRTVDGLPGLLDEVGATVVRAERLAMESRPVVRRLRTASSALPVAQDAAADLLPDVARLLRLARPELRRARRVLPQVEGLVGQAGRTVPAAREVTRQMPPFFSLLSAYRTQLVSWAAKLGAITQPTIPGAGDVPQHYIRLAAVLPNEPLLGTSRRQPFHRSNPYPAPGALSALEDGVPKAFDCRWTAGGTTFPALGGIPPCVTAPPWTFEGKTATWPRLLPRK